jgi:hypothetical protein
MMNYGNYCASCGSRRNPTDDEKASAALDQSAFSIDITFNMGLEVTVGDDGIERTTPTMDVGVEVSNVKGTGCHGIIDDLLDGVGKIHNTLPKPEMFDVPEEIEMEEEYEPEMGPQPQLPTSQSAAPKPKGQGRRKGRAQEERTKESDRQSEQMRKRKRRRRRNPSSCSNCGEGADGSTCWNCGWDL